MPEKNRKKLETKGTRMPVMLIMVVVIVGAGWLVWSQVDRYRTGDVGAKPAQQGSQLGEGPGQGRGEQAQGGQGEQFRRGGAGGPGGQGGNGGGRFLRGDQVNSQNMQPPSREEMRNQFSNMLDSIGATEEQKKKLMSLSPPEKPGDFQKYREKMEQVLTPEQQEKLRQQFRSRIQSHIDRVMEGLSPEDREALRQRIEARRAEWEQRQAGQQQQGAPAQ